MNDILIDEVLRPKWEALKTPGDQLRLHDRYVDIEPEFWPIYDKVRELTLTSVERLYDLWKSVHYIVRAGIPGSIVECGVYQGASMMLVALTLKELGDTDRTLVLYDTFEGMPPPRDDSDVDLIGRPATSRWYPGWIRVPLGAVSTNMISTGYPISRMQFIRGMVEDTLPKIKDEASRAAIVRLDTDWKSSTAVELQYLWPKLSVGGLMIVDDYGHWLGAREATDEFFADKFVKMHRVDYTCRVIQKVTE